MSDHDIRSLAREAIAGTVTALGPLLDLLLETGDWRAQGLHTVIGWLVSKVEAKHALSVNVRRECRRRMWELFWPELSENGGMELLKQAEDVFVRQEEAKAEEEVGEGVGEEPDSPPYTNNDDIWRRIEEIQRRWEEEVARGGVESPWRRQIDRTPKWT